jgi:hypothetical protein
VGVRGVTIGSELLGALALRGDEASEPHPPLHNIVGNAGRGLVIIGGVGQAGSAEGGPTQVANTEQSTSRLWSDPSSLSLPASPSAFLGSSMVENCQPQE